MTENQRAALMTERIILKHARIVILSKAPTKKRFSTNSPLNITNCKINGENGTKVM